MLMAQVLRYDAPRSQGDVIRRGDAHRAALQRLPGSTARTSRAGRAQRHKRQRRRRSRRNEAVIHLIPYASIIAKQLIHLDILVCVMFIFEVKRMTVMFAPMLSTLLIGNRMRALQLALQLT